MERSSPHLLMVGSLSPGAIETHYFAHLKKSDLRVSFFEPSGFYKVKSIWDKVKFRYFPGTLFKSANVALLETIDRELPDMVWIFKGIEFFPETLKQIKDKGIMLINYNPDHPFIRSFVSNGGKNIEESVPIYDVHFCYSRDLTTKMQTEYHLKSYWLPFGYDLTDEDYRTLYQESEVNRVCFVGNPDQFRAETVKAIARQNHQVDVYGYNWKKYLSPDDRIRIFDQVVGLEYWKTLRKYRLQLNIFRPHNVNSHNMRTFEIPACWGIQVAPYSEENEMFFEPEKEIFLYKNDEELTGIVQHVLNMSVAEANVIRDDARSRVVKDHCSYEYRAQYVADILKSL